jgi:hypothetical protein
MVQQAVKMPQGNWVRRVEHVMLRVVSFVFSVVSAHAMLWFFSALDWVDFLQPWVKWGIALGFGILGYFVSRGLAHRLLNKERVTAYLFVCGVFEFVEVVCNYSMAASSAEGIGWLSRIHGLQHQVLVLLVYVVLSIIPVVTVMLAWVDMDLERAKQGYEVRGFGIPSPGGMGNRGASFVPRPGAVPQPKTMTPGVPTRATAPGPFAPSVPSYSQGYSGGRSAPLVEEEVAQASSGWWNGVRDRLPFGRREQEPSTAPPPPTPLTMTPPPPTVGG